VAIKIVCDNIATLHPVSVMMGSGKSYRREFNKLQKSFPKVGSIINPKQNREERN
jgi:hypothetical protein